MIALNVELDAPVALAPTMINWPTRCGKLMPARIRTAVSGAPAGEVGAEVRSVDGLAPAPVTAGGLL